MNGERANRYSLDDVRFKIAASRRMLFRGGCDSQIAGHVSVRAEGEDAFYVTPYQYFDETLPEHVTKVSFDLEVLEQGTLPASPGINFHADIFRARDDVNSVVHTHALNPTLLTSVSKRLGNYQIYAAMFHNDVAFFEDDPSMTPDVEGPALAKCIGTKRAMLMSHHGVVHAGSSLENATGETLLFNIAAGYHLEALKIGGKEMDDRTVDTYRRLYEKIEFPKLFWDANFRRLRKSDPDLFAYAD